jgi:hypothetical protein
VTALFERNTGGREVVPSKTFSLPFYVKVWNSENNFTVGGINLPTLPLNIENPIA